MPVMTSLVTPGVMRHRPVSASCTAVAAGTVKLCGVVQDDIVTMAERLIRDKSAYDAMAHAVNRCQG